ncbi:family 20 glycosylhydrolase, partial [bacterium]|nr:family 20 glycosylhydrolase [bacterium]
IDLIQPTDFLYLNDPIPDDSPLSENEKRFILGGEATMWGEYVSWETVDSRIWPRTAAIAERFWSPGCVRDVEDIYIRLDCISRHLEELGLTHEKNVDMMLRRLSNSTDIRALKVLVDVIEPVKGYKRGAQKKHTSTSPLTRMVDAARPDARTAREFRKRADQYVKDPLKGSYDLNDLTQLLVLWKKNHDELLPVIQKSPALKEIKTLSEDLSRIAGIGLEALNYIQTKQNAGEDWLENKLNILEKSKLPRAQTELMIVSAIELLVRRAEKQKSD